MLAGASVAAEDQALALRFEVPPLGANDSFTAQSLLLRSNVFFDSNPVQTTLNRARQATSAVVTPGQLWYRLAP